MLPCYYGLLAILILLPMSPEAKGSIIVQNVPFAQDKILQVCFCQVNCILYNGSSASQKGKNKSPSSIPSQPASLLALRFQ